ncbi:MAG: ATP-dependent DNA helicase RecG [Fusobacteriia bacterium 4572_132]|nr:MAG: ATP-dependent DNA helicase RecG [Fusobacteriia bacterium 4572_132]
MKDYLCLYQELKDVKIKNLGPRTIRELEKININRVIDLLYFFPKDYEDRGNQKKINELKIGEHTVVKGKISQSNLLRVRNGRGMLKIVISDGTGMLEVIWFGMAYLKKQLTVGKEITVIGDVKRKFGLQMVNPEYRLGELENDDEKIGAEYGSLGGIPQKRFKKIMEETLKQYSPYLYEILPEKMRKKYNLRTRKQVLANIHFPQNDMELEKARQYLIIEELMILEIGILEKRFILDMENREKYKLDNKKEKVKEFLDKLHFELTKAQKRVITEIYKDLNMGKISNRLLQGDVGSGKTIVAVIMLIYMVENGYQGVFMAPTEILAEQHYIGIVDILTELGIRVEILTGSIKGQKREKLLQETKEGKINILVGTHALIEDNVVFDKLGYIIIDEQHRFGVKQRTRLREKGILANLLVMSATPIPRSLALSIYGDLDVSIIDELPPGRKDIKTKWIKSHSKLDKVYDFIKKKVIEGRQIYIVCPLIEESEKMDLKSTEEVYEELTNDIFPDMKIELLHGRIKNKEKEEIMRNFKGNKIKILVSTTVIEVGVNVPNASIMMILDAQRFGLAQLHQLRGRVGRGEYQSYCFLVAETKNEFSKARLEVMEKTNDGFRIAEEDLKLRKPGEIFGTRQSGISDLRFTEIIRDVKTIKLARDEAIEYLEENKGKIENEFLKKDIEIKFAKKE